MLVSGTLTALSAALLPKDFWFAVLGLCGVGWVVLGFYYVRVERPRTVAAQRLAETQAQIARESANPSDNYLGDYAHEMWQADLRAAGKQHEQEALKRRGLT